MFNCGAQKVRVAPDSGVEIHFLGEGMVEATVRATDGRKLVAKLFFEFEGRLPTVCDVAFANVATPTAGTLSRWDGVYIENHELVVQLVNDTFSRSQDWGG